MLMLEILHDFIDQSCRNSGNAISVCIMGHAGFPSSTGGPEVWAAACGCDSMPSTSRAHL